MSATQDKIDELKAEVAKTQGVVDSVKVYVAGLLEQLEEAKDDPEELQEIIDAHKASLGDLAAVVPSPEPPAEPVE